VDQRDALLAAIRETPEDDGPRLVYADWLEEHGDEHDRARAEFIRVQCELARGAPRDRQRELQVRERALQKGHQAAWLGPLWSPAGETRVAFHRGLATLEMDATKFLARSFQEQAPEHFRQAGVVGLTLWCPGGPLEGLAESAVLGRLASLEVDQDPFERGLAASLAANPHLAGLSSLELGSQGLEEGALRTLAESPHLRNLTRLAPAGVAGGPRPADLEALTAPGAFPNLVSLSLPGWDFSHNDLDRLLRASYAPKLTSLELAGRKIGDGGVRALVDSALPANLERLGLAGNFIGRSGFRALAEASFPRLRALDLAGNIPGGTAALLKSPGLGRLTKLNLAYVRLGDAGVKALARCPGLARLTHLGLGRTGVTAEGLRALGESPHAANLTCLSLPTDALGKGLSGVLARSPSLAGLLVLRLEAGRTTPAAQALGRLASSPHLAGLSVLDLGSLPLGDDLAGVLAQAPFRGRLSQLVVDGKGLSPESLRRLKKSFGVALELEPFAPTRKSRLVHEWDE
jgi:uncharacterized protein (TIGR02996 family)